MFNHDFWWAWATSPDKSMNWAWGRAVKNGVTDRSQAPKHVPNDSDSVHLHSCWSVGQHSRQGTVVAVAPMLSLRLGPQTRWNGCSGSHPVGMQLVAEAQPKAEPQEAWGQAETLKETLTTQFAGSRLFGDIMPAAEVQPTVAPQEACRQAAAPNDT